MRVDRIPLRLDEDGAGLHISGFVVPIDEWPRACNADMSAIPRSPGCYVLFVDDRLIYIGESDNLSERLRNHNVDFEECAWLRLDGAQRFLVEKMLIWSFMPERNLELKRHDWRMLIKKEVLA